MSSRVAPHQEGGLQAAFRRAVAGQPRFVRAQVFDVVGQLVVQETGGVLAADGDQAEVGDRGDDAVGRAAADSVRPKSSTCVASSWWKRAPSERGVRSSYS
jgi:hypothetical protein